MKIEFTEDWKVAIKGIFVQSFAKGDIVDDLPDAEAELAIELKVAIPASEEAAAAGPEPAAEAEPAKKAPAKKAKK